MRTVRVWILLSLSLETGPGTRGQQNWKCNSLKSIRQRRTRREGRNGVGTQQTIVCDLRSQTGTEPNAYGVAGCVGFQSA
ncbi:hypothetical protein C8R45DRAFT_1003104 [Mycena sanguinolenta]|nr:hypothetical protein C8R45DRAFT_1003104 [Mycena sanguinolenta]